MSRRHSQQPVNKEASPKRASREASQQPANKEDSQQPADKEVGYRKPFNPLRAPNAFAAAFIVIFFLVHASLGVFAILSGWRGALAWTVWIGAGVIGFHIIMSLATTISMFTDKVRVASKGKRRHQLLKWATGGCIVLMFAWHVSGAQRLLDAPSFLVAIAAVALISALCWHVWIGAKSLTHDLRISPVFRTPIRGVFITVAAILSIVLLTSLVF
jgi:hypothetical protein